MPFYEYQCQACGAQVEVMQKISDSPLKKCPECGKSRLTKLISAPVFRLKGGGWYETDFKSDKENKRNLVETEKAESKSDDKAADKSTGKDTGKGESRGDSKAEPKPEAKSVDKPDKKAYTAKPLKPVKPAKPAKRKARR